jgi:uncharacterized protein YlaI
MKLSLTTIFIALSIVLIGQVNSKLKFCDGIIKIDAKEFNAKRIKAKTLLKINTYKKAKNRVLVTTNDTTLVFKDVFDKDGERLYSNSIVAFDTLRNWKLVEYADLITSKFYLVNLKTSKIDTLCGIPKIFGNKMVCFESQYTDGGDIFQIWTIENDKVILNKTYMVHWCEIYGLDKYYLNNNFLYFGDYYNEKYYKLDITK